MVRGAGRPEERDRFDTSNSPIRSRGFGRLPFIPDSEAARAAALLAGSPWLFPHASVWRPMADRIWKRMVNGPPQATRLGSGVRGVASEGCWPLLWLTSTAPLGPSISRRGKGFRPLGQELLKRFLQAIDDRGRLIGAV